MRSLRDLKGNKRGIAQVIVVAAIALIIGGLFWIIMTYPASIMTSTGSFRSDALATVQAINLMIGAMPIMAGFVVLFWSIARTIEERETGIGTI
jgi:ABC-type multidrug transport system permease subunit